VPIETGQQLLHYRLIEKIGEGGMGVVWKALDTTLNREVAIKVLPHDIAADPDRLARFEREARLLATLNHSNIAAVYGLHHAADVHFIVMELVSGETLSEVLNRGAAPLDATLNFAVQIAEALEAAHDRGIVHRDLKPANVKIRPDGVLKVLDFGLARAQAAESNDGSNGDVATVTSTRVGTIMGTAPYMSPDQARGKPVCKRADIWALGCVIYECLSGRRPFEGATTTDTLAKIVTREPDYSSLPPNTPPFLIGLIRRCLEKEARQRLRDAGEVRVAIEGFRSNPATGDVSAPRREGRLSPLLPWVVVAALTLALVYALVGGAFRSDLPRPTVSRWTIPLPTDTRVDLPGPGGKFDYSNAVAISRDGTQIAFSVLDRENQAQLYLKADAAEPRPIPGTTNARAPFFSPDGQWLGFYDSGKLWKVALRGGSPQMVCEVGGRAIAFDATWSSDGKTILFTDDGIWRASVADGVTERLTQPDPARGELGHHAPRFISDGRSILFTVSGPAGTHLALMSLEATTWEILVRDAGHGVAVDPDQIVFARSSELFAVPFDNRGRRVTGPEVPVLQGIHTSPGLGGMIVTWFDVADNGTLAYIPTDVGRPDEQLVWVDFDGTETVIAEGPGTWVHPRLSPDGRRISLDIHSADGMRDIHIYEMERRQFRQLTHNGVTWESEWRPDGEALAVLSGAQPGKWSLFEVRADFSDPPELLVEADHAIPGSWLDGGRAILYTEWNAGGFYRLQIDGERKPELILRTDRRQGFPRVSPDGNWVVYVADESSRREVFVRSYPELGATHKVSIDGGREPVWSRDGRRIYYRKGKQMLAVNVDFRPAISFGQPRILFEGEYDAAEVGHQHFEISHDDTRFLMVKHGEPLGPREVRVVLNWSEELRELSAVGSEGAN
jgi:serine/threonine protein kinase/Tol biopolymer transport system component